MADVFLSYAREDLGRVRMLAEVLTEQGWSVWWDRDIPAGDEFDAVIERELSRARCVVVLWSKTSVGKRWVKTEARDGLERKILIPVLLERTLLPLEFRGIQAIPLENWGGARLDTGLRLLLEAVSRLLGGPRPEIDSGGLLEDDLRPGPETIDPAQLKAAVFSMEFRGMPQGTGFGLGASTLLVSDANVYNAVRHMDTGNLERQRGGGVAIEARPMDGGPARAAGLILPPDSSQDLALFDTTPWPGPGVIGLDRDPAVAGEEILCAIAAGDRTGVHRGRIEKVDESTTIAGMPTGPGVMDRLLVTDIVTSGGSAGSPVLRPNGALLGVIVAGDRETRSFALPASRLWERLRQARLI